LTDTQVPHSINRIRVDREVVERYPSFRLRVIYALGVSNSASDDTSKAWLRAGAERAFARVGDAKLSEHPRIQAWRQAYGVFGAKPSAYPCSAESLARRVVKGGIDAVPVVNKLVDAYNAVSLAHLLPIGGEDLDKLSGEGRLRFVTAGDQLPLAGEDGDLADPPVPGEVVWADDLSWTCRRWNWRQGKRTRLTESTTNAYFVIEGMHAADAADSVEAATAELCALIQGSANPARIEVVRVL